MVSQKTSKTNKYNATFPTILRKLMSKHPIGGRPTTQKELARELDIRPQTVSLYVNGITQPSPDTLVNIANFFNVSIDYLLTGVSSFNKETNTSLGLTETSINALKFANRTKCFNGMPTVMDILNILLSDYDFYDFLSRLSFKANSIHIAVNMTPEQKHSLGDLNIESYYIWDMQMFIQNFIQKQLEKNGLGIKNK